MYINFNPKDGYSVTETQQEKWNYGDMLPDFIEDAAAGKPASCHYYSSEGDRIGTTGWLDDAERISDELSFQYHKEAERLLHFLTDYETANPPAPTKRGPPKGSKCHFKGGREATLSVRIPADLKQRLDATAGKRGKADYVIDALEAKLAGGQ